MTHVTASSPPTAASPRDYRDLAIQDLASDVVALEALVYELAERLCATQELVGAGWDYLAWLQAELCRARQWTTLDVVSAWHDELERRAKMRAEVAA